jgi:hypothetical protein
VDEPGWQEARERPARRLPVVLGLLAAVVLVGLLVRVDDGSGGDRNLEVADDPEPRPTPRRTRSPRPPRSPPPAPPEASGTWTAGAALPLAPRDVHGVWSGTELLLWGGELWGPDGGRRTFLGDGAAYDPAADRWRPIAPSPLAERAGHAAVWTGGELLVWGGSGPVGYFADGAAYDPAADRWRPIAPSPLSPRAGASAVWTGEEALVLGGFDNAGPLGDVAAYHPARDAWRVLPFPEAIAGIAGYQGMESLEALWDGHTAVLWHRWDYHPGAARVARYDPRTGSWTDLPPVPAARGSAPATRQLLWTGSELVAVLFRGDGRPADVALLAPGDGDWRVLELSPTRWRTSSQGEGAVVWGGDRLYLLLGSARGIALDVHRGEWALLPDAPWHRRGWAQSAVWTGDALLAWQRADPHAGPDRPWLEVALWRPAG